MINMPEARAWFKNKIIVGFYLTVMTAPFLGLIIDFSKYQWSRSLPYLKNVQAPLADLLVLIVFGLLIMNLLYSRLKKKNIDIGLRLNFLDSGFFYFLPFLISGLFSLINVPGEQLSSSFKYWLRPILFFYLMWIFLPLAVIESKKILNKTLFILFIAGLFSACLGWFSLFKNENIFSFWQRLTPGGLWGLAPLTYNHNILAEVLIMVIPLAFYLFGRQNSKEKPSNKQKQKIYFIFITFLILTALLTFSRAGWVALFFEVLIYFWLKNKRPISREEKEAPQPKILFKKIGLSALILLPLILYMFFFSLSATVLSSNATRWDMTKIAWTYFTEHPWLGNGVGTFTALVADTRLFTVEYGDTLDAHGLVQKLIAEEGLLGLITFFIFLAWIIGKIYENYREAVEENNRNLLLLLFISALGCLSFQLFNTSYYNQHLWLPIGLALAAGKVLNYEQKN